MFDIVIKGGTIVDGTGAPRYTADVGVTDGRITEIGDVQGPARSVIDADGAVVTPGFVDIHTHYDGQATWDDAFEPSAAHGVTTVVMGNCGVGFAPVRPADAGTLIDMMEGVEDIPGTARQRRDALWRVGDLPGVPRLPGRTALRPRRCCSDPARRTALLRDGRASGH